MKKYVAFLMLILTLATFLSSCGYKRGNENIYTDSYPTQYPKKQ